MEDIIFTNPTVDAELSNALARIGLGNYEERLRTNGFDDWDSVMAITEGDMAEMDFKLGDRRKLQRAIYEKSISTASTSDQGPETFPSSSKGVPTSGEHTESTTRPSQQAGRQTRVYRRHPRQDPNAPRKPKTAYVLFGEHVRQDPALRNSSFAELARETGRRWRELSQDERTDVWETPAAEKLLEFRREFERYKQTESYQNHQAYLEEHKQQHNKPEVTTPSDTKSAATSKATPPSPPPQEEHEESVDEGVDLVHINLEEHVQDITSSIEFGMEEVRHISAALGVNPNTLRTIAVPVQDITTKAVEAFIHGTGSLLYLWTPDEALALVQSVYDPQCDSSPVDAVEVFAMAAVGVCCDGDVHSYTMLLQERFLHFFLSMLSSAMNMCDLRRMRLLACLAICRFTNSVKSARSLMLTALSIGKQTLSSPSLEAERSTDNIYYWRNVFQSIVFLESWFAYNTGHPSRVTFEDLNLCYPSRRTTNHPHEGYQQRVGELGQLAAYIALDLKEAKKPKVAQAQVHFESLHKWHRTLPPPMQLSQLSIADPFAIDWHSRRSLLQLHILFLGLFIEPYRQCFVDLGKYRLSSTPNAFEDVETLKNVVEQCVIAARQSARVASLLQTGDLIRCRCWVSVYTCYTGCVILLFSAAQNLLELQPYDVGQDLAYASSHLNVLSLCSYDNPMARKLYTALQVTFNDIREVMVSPVYRRMRKEGVVVRDVILGTGVESGIGAGEKRGWDHGNGEGEAVKEVARTILELARRTMDSLQDSLNSEP